MRAIQYGQPQIGLSWYPEGQGVSDEQAVHLVPYTFGLRPPYANAPAPASFEGGYNQGYASGSYDASLRVGGGGLLIGAAIGALTTWLIMR